jgi:hypothetical protein
MSNRLVAKDSLVVPKIAFQHVTAAISPDANTNVGSVTNLYRSRRTLAPSFPTSSERFITMDSIPSCHVPGRTRAKHRIQHATYGAYRHCGGKPPRRGQVLPKATLAENAIDRFRKFS